MTYICFYGPCAEISQFEKKFKSAEKILWPNIKEPKSDSAFMIHLRELEEFDNSYEDKLLTYLNEHIPVKPCVIDCYVHITFKKDSGLSLSHNALSQMGKIGIDLVFASN